MTVYPPTLPAEHLPHLLVQLIQGSFFTIIPSSSNASGAIPVPEWHAGNIYGIKGVRPRAVNFPIPPSTTSPTVYEIFISGDYEVLGSDFSAHYNQANHPLNELVSR